MSDEARNEKYVSLGTAVDFMADQDWQHIDAPIAASTKRFLEWLKFIGAMPPKIFTPDGESAALTWDEGNGKGWYLLIHGEDESASLLKLPRDISHPKPLDEASKPDRG